MISLDPVRMIRWSVKLSKYLDYIYCPKSRKTIFPPPQRIVKLLPGSVRFIIDPTTLEDLTAVHDVSINYVKRVSSPGEPLSLFSLSLSFSLSVSIYPSSLCCRCRYRCHCCRCRSLLSVLWRFKKEREKERPREREEGRRKRVPRRGSSQPRRESSWETRSRVRRRPWCRKTVRNIGTGSMDRWLRSSSRRGNIVALLGLRCPGVTRKSLRPGGSFHSQ